MNNYPTFVAGKLKPASQILEQITPEKIDLAHCACGLSGESGEVLDEIKKHVFTGKPLKREKLTEELGDCLFYLTGLCNALDLDMDDLIQNNVLKLDSRYQDGYSDKAAAARRDEA